jgi:hypothetical protein
MASGLAQQQIVCNTTQTGKSKAVIEQADRLAFMGHSIYICPQKCADEEFFTDHQLFSVRICNAELSRR